MSDDIKLANILPKQDGCWNCTCRIRVQPLVADGQDYDYCGNEKNLALVRKLMEQAGIEKSHQNTVEALKISLVHICGNHNKKGDRT